MVFFKKLKVGLQRIFQSGGIGFESEEKRFGNAGESEVIDGVCRNLQNCRIKSNVLVSSLSGDAEIDCLILYNNNLFALEIKHWKGCLIEQGDYIVCEKVDKYTGEVHKKMNRSPFKQVKRAISLLKEQTKISIWIQPIVVFIGAEQINVSTKEPWVSTVDELIAFIKNFNSVNKKQNSIACFNKSCEADALYSSFGRICRGNIQEQGLKFIIENSVYKKKDIATINIKHHFSFDDLFITLKNGENKKISIDNGSIFVYHNKDLHKYNFSKINYIKIGNVKN